jgi:hypothetical protein
MINLPTYADVFCVDGLAGRCTALVGNLNTHKLAYIVVRSLRPPFQEYLVPVDQVLTTGPARITLKCTRAALHQMAPFEVEAFVLTDVPRYMLSTDAWADPSTASQGIPTYLPVKRQNLSDDEIALRRGARVEATDGYAGQVLEVLLDADTGQVAGFVLLRAHTSEPHEIYIPASQLERVFEDKVYIKLDRPSLDEMPAAPSQR